MGEGITPDLSEVILAAIDSRLLDVHTMIPCKVEAFSTAAQTVDVLPQIKRLLEKADGSLEPEALPKLGNIPVAFPQAGGNFLTLPIAKGDYGMLVISEASLDQWRNTGAPAVPGDNRRHSLAGAVFYPGLVPAAGKIDGIPDDAVVLGAVDEVRLGSVSAGDEVITASVLAAVLQAGVAAGGPGAANFTAADTSLTTQLGAKTFRVKADTP